MRSPRTLVLLAAVSVAVAALVFSAGATAEPRWQTNSDFRALPTDSVAPLLSDMNADVIPDSYIVVLKKDLTPDQLEQHHELLSMFLATHGGLVSDGGTNELRHVYDMEGLRGYAGKFTSDVVDQVRTAPEVAYIEKDSTVYANEVQTDAPWGLARISHTKQLTFRNFHKYEYNENAGEGITAYIIDTGVNINHEDLKGRARWGATIPTNDPNEDGNGHGSHVAGTVAGTRYGVAKKAEIVAVKVLRSNGSGSMSDVLRGVEWAAKDHQLAMASKSDKRRGSVANMSLGGGMSRALNQAVNEAVRLGVHFAVAAGNDNRDACDYSPASATEAVTVGASTVVDERAWFSNHGKCVDVFGPGKDITSIWNSGPHSTNTISGTSMASPHVCGVLAYLLSLEKEPESVSPKDLKDKLLKTALSNMLVDKLPKGTPNLLLHLPQTEDGANGHTTPSFRSVISWFRQMFDPFTTVIV